MTVAFDLRRQFVFLCSDVVEFQQDAARPKSPALPAAPLEPRRGLLPHRDERESGSLRPLDDSRCRRTAKTAAGARADQNIRVARSDSTHASLRAGSSAGSRKYCTAGVTSSPLANVQFQYASTTFSLRAPDGRVGGGAALL